MEQDNNEEQRYSERWIAVILWTQGRTGSSFMIALFGVISAGIAHILPPPYHVEFDWRVGVAWCAGVFIFRSLKRPRNR